MGDEHEQVNDHGANNCRLGKNTINSNRGLVHGSKAALLLLWCCVGSVRPIVFGARGLCHQVRVKNLGDGQSSSNTDNRCQRQHQTNHNSGEVARAEGIYDNEDVLVPEVLEAEIDTSREQPDQEVQVEEESRPCGRLVLRNGGNDGDMNLGIASVPEGVKATTPRSNVPERSQGYESSQTHAERGHDHSGKESLKLASRDGRPDVGYESDKLEETKDA